MIASSNTYLQANTLTTQIQIMLNELNFNAGPEDGIYGNKTNSSASCHQMLSSILILLL